jgi:hypothetical protein
MDGTTRSTHSWIMRASKDGKEFRGTSLHVYVRVVRVCVSEYSEFVLYTRVYSSNDFLEKREKRCGSFQVKAHQADFSQPIGRRISPVNVSADPFRVMHINPTFNNFSHQSFRCCSEYLRIINPAEVQILSGHINPTFCNRMFSELPKVAPTTDASTINPVCYWSRGHLGPSMTP